jgi:hypothetical protein
LMLACSLVIIQDARPEIGDAPLTLISRMGQWACCLPCHIESWPTTRHSIDVTMQPFDCRKDQTKIVDAPIDVYFWDIPTVIRCATIMHDSPNVIIDSQ